MRWEVATAQLFQGFALGLLGSDPRCSAARYPVLLKEANDRGDLYAATSLRACLGFYVPLSHDEPEVAHREVDDAMARWSVHGFHLQHANALNSRTMVDLYLGQVCVRSSAATPNGRHSSARCSCAASCCAC